MDENFSNRTVGKLITALAKAKLAMPKLVASETANIKNDKANYSYKYADLADVLEVITLPLAQNGLVFMQFPAVEYSGTSARVTVCGSLYHESGEVIEAMPLVLSALRVDPQGVGGVITYARRYQAVSFFGLAQEDDDAASASSKFTSQTKAPVVNHPQNRAMPSANVAHRTAEPPTVDFSMDDVPENPTDAEWAAIPGAPKPLVKDNSFTWPVALDQLEVLAGFRDVGEVGELPARMMKYFAENHAASAQKPLSTKQYNTLAGFLDRRYGKDSHRAILSALCGTVVTAENPPGWKVKELLDWFFDPSTKAAKESMIVLDELAEILHSSIAELLAS